MLFGQWLMIRYRERHLLQQVYSSFTVDAANTDERRRTQKGLDKRISSLH
jgi:hypothetical protein